jgi:hypothetical protein
VVAKFRERLAVIKQVAQNLEGEILNLRKLNYVEVRKQKQTKISKRLSAFENLNDSEDIDRAWEFNKGISKPQLKETRSARVEAAHEEYLRFLDQRQQAKMQWLQDPKQSKQRKT